jgi:hypothetical protein
VTVAEVIGVVKTPKVPERFHEGDRLLIEFLFGVIFVLRTEHFASDGEAVQVRVGPTHGNLKHGVEIGKPNIAGNEQPAPHSGQHIIQGDSQLNYGLFDRIFPGGRHP